MALKNNTRIGIMGGTFDPIHYGHLRAADEAKAALDLSCVIFVPAGHPPHKVCQDVTNAEDRYTMALLATVDCPYFSVSRMEIERSGESYTVDTLKNLKSKPDYIGCDFYFITGLDAVLDILSWKDAEEMFDLCKFVAVSRHGYTHSSMKVIPAEISSRIIQLEIPLLAISSTELRDRVRRNRSIRFLVPPSVESYIIKNGLYKAK